MPKLKEKCPLCDPSIDKETHDIIWRGLAKGGRKGAISAALSRNIKVEEKDVRRHFEYHRPRQGRPLETLAPKDALKKSKKLVERKQALIEAALRLGAIEEDFIANLIYWKGDPSKKLSARKAAARDLRFLLNDDFLFRIYHENLPGKSIWLPDGVYHPPAYFLGVNGRSLASERTGFEIKRDDFCSAPEDKKSWANVMKIAGANCLVDAMSLEIKNPTEPLTQRGSVAGLAVSFSVKNFAHGGLIKLRLKDPNKKISELRVSGVGAIVFYDKKENPFLFPFFYYYDDGRRKPEKIAADIISTQVISKSGQVKELLPDLESYQSIPVIVIAKDKIRLSKIKDETKKRKREALPDSMVFASTRDGLAGFFQKKDWVSLFSEQKNGLNIFQIALKSYGKNPISKETLEIKGQKANKKGS